MADDERAFWDEVEALFFETTSRHPATRAAFVADRCADNPRLRTEVTALVAAHERSNGFLEIGSVDGGGFNVLQPSDDERGRTIGPFRLVERIGVGGMGVVYRAERVHGDFTQHVAIKLLDRLPRASEAMRRFRLERQILATLHHPNIVALMDGGVTEDGHAFLVMEYVEGVPLTEYCTARAASLDERLGLFLDVCGAVGYAHDHRIVHRDLKPANILVAGGTIKVLDFGVAKLLDTPAAEVEPTAGIGRALTPNYASPEQLRGLPVTPASDIYALGVVLYELLAGVRPYETQKQPLDRVLAMVVQDAPPAPSGRADTARLPYELRRLRGDLDAIILKAVEKDPSNRYSSADALADDVKRHLAGEAVHVRRANSTYRAAILVRRHGALAVIAMVVTLIVAIAAWRFDRVGISRIAPTFGVSPAASRAGSSGSRDSRANDAYARARTLWNRRASAADLTAAVEQFQQAIAIDPAYAAAYVGVADSYLVMGDLRHMPPADAYQRAKRAVTRAVEIDETLAEAHRVLGAIAFGFDRDWAVAEREYQRAIELDPNDGTSHQWYGEFLMAIGRQHDALTSLDRAMRADPNSSMVAAVKAWLLYLARDYRASIDQSGRVLAKDATFLPARLYRAWSYTELGEFEAARTDVDTLIAMSRASPVLAAQAVLDARTGRSDKAIETADELIGRSYAPAWDIAKIFASLDRADQTMLWLERASGEHASALLYAEVEPQLDPVRGHPRFRQLIDRLGVRSPNPP